jgi:hypothetical protein
MTEERTVGFEPTASSLESWRSTYRATLAWRPLYQAHPANVSARRHILLRRLGERGCAPVRWCARRRGGMWGLASEGCLRKSTHSGE